MCGQSLMPAVPAGWPCSAWHHAIINLFPGTDLLTPPQCLVAVSTAPIVLEAIGLVQRIFGGVLVALAALGFAGVQRPKGPKP